MTAQRGVLYVKWGTGMESVLARSIASLRLHHPEMPVHIHELPEGSNLLAKANLFDFSPFASTLYLDLDTVVLGPLDHGFLQAERHGLACCVSECPYARRHVGLAAARDLIEYNTGVLFFTRKAEPIFNRWSERARHIDSRVVYLSEGTVRQQACNDQAAFAKAVDEIADESGRFPFVLPVNWNFRPSWNRIFFGDLKIWHDYRDPPAQLVEWCRLQAQPDAITGSILLKPPAGASEPPITLGAAQQSEPQPA